jgi:16S rRNA (cytosine967-C5)-methyltransferase
MSVVGSQQRTLLDLLGRLRAHWRTDRNLPARVQHLLARNRSFGSRDRRLYRELIYTTLRYLPWIEPSLADKPEAAALLIAWLSADVPSTERFRSQLVGDWPACPASVEEKAAVLNRRFFPETEAHATQALFRPDDLLPAWLHDECPEAFVPSQRDALQTRSPLWLRLNPDTAERVREEFQARAWRSQFSTLLPTALRVLDEADVTQSDAFKTGCFEIQDLGSQLILESAALSPGGRWLDACAGAGGKTLQLAQMLGPTGHVDAFDVRPAALQELAVRAERARLRTIHILAHPPTQTYDGVRVDAPCTGSGTWRRAPHLKWTTSQTDVAKAAVLQRTLLSANSALVRKGGRLVYATCSLAKTENEAVADQFLQSHVDFETEAPHRNFGGLVRGGGLTFLPALHDSDGFFVAAFRRKR